MSKVLFNLLCQLDRLYKHCRQGSYKTRQHYYEAMKCLECSKGGEAY